MAGARIEVKLDAGRALGGLRRAERVLSMGGEKAMWADIGEEAVQSVQKNFDQEGRPKKWKDWSVEYGEWRQAHRGEANGEEKILSLSGVLRNSINARPYARRVVIGTNVEYAATHQFGRGAIPARPYLMVQPEDYTEFGLIIEEHIADAFNG
jgi:phage virion morphogenesis protein